jgi:branched-chain amino acid transport system ATP-binding protein
MLKIEHISSGYGKKQVLFDISFEVKENEIILLSGGNGSGKSTLLKCIFNLLPLWRGATYLDGQRIDQLKSSELIKKGMVYIPQKNFCFDNLTVNENLMIAGNIYQRNEMNKRLNEVYSLSGLFKIKERKPFSLSGGEKKLLAFGMSLMHKPKIVLFDEPFAGIDMTKTLEFLNVFNSHFVRNGITLVIVEHKDTGKKMYTSKIILELGCIKKSNHEKIHYN